MQRGEQPKHGSPHFRFEGRCDSPDLRDRAVELDETRASGPAPARRLLGDSEQACWPSLPLLDSLRPSRVPRLTMPECATGPAIWSVRRSDRSREERATCSRARRPAWVRDGQEDRRARRRQPRLAGASRSSRRARGTSERSSSSTTEAGAALTALRGAFASNSVQGRTGRPPWGASGHVVLPAIRATTHVDGKPTRLSCRPHRRRCS